MFIDDGERSNVVGLTMSEPVPRNTPAPLLETIGVKPVEPNPKSNADWLTADTIWPEIGREFGRRAWDIDDSSVSVLICGTSPQQVGWCASSTN